MNSQERAATKFCKACKTVKPVSDFSVGRAVCKRCRCDEQMAIDASPENRARKQEYNARYYAENRESVLAQKSEYGKREGPAERAKALRRERYNNDPVYQAKSKQRRERHYRNNKPQYRERDAMRRAMELRATPKWADRKAIRKFYELAAKLTWETGVQHEVDHIIPLGGKRVSGLHVHTNLQVLAMRANRSKFNRLVDDVV